MRILFTLLLISCITVVKAQIPNTNFENWTITGNAGDSLNDWTTSERTVRNYGGMNNVFKGTDPQEGSFSIHMKNVQVTIGGFITVKGPGVATNGLIAFNAGNFTFTFSI